MAFLLGGPAFLLGGCQTLPASGPTAALIEKAHRRLADFDLVDLDEPALARLARASTDGVGHLGALDGSGEVDRIGPGDVLQISVYEVGASLFAARAAALGSGPSALGTGEPLPAVTVGRDGRVQIPWAGRVMAQGRTADELADTLTGLYRHASENPQVMVAIRDNVSNSVMVQGDVKKPGRVPLTLARETILDAIAIGGGANNPDFDTVVQLHRAGRSEEERLGAIHPGSGDDLRLLPQDRIALSYRPRTFTMLGATGKVAEIPFQSPRVSLVEAIGRGAGPSDDRADPAAVYVFRYEPAAYDGTPGADARPVAYRLNMRQPQSYFRAQRFEMRPRDVIYVANADATLPTKAIQILNLFFSPVYTAKVLAQ